MKKFVDHYPMLILGLLLLGAVGIGAYQYYPVHRQRQAFRSLLAEEELRLEEIQQCSEQLPGLLRQVLMLESETSEFPRLFPNEQGFSRLWEQITEVMARAQLADQSVRPGEVVCENGLCSVPLEIRCTGSFEQIFELFQSLERFERLIRIEEVTLKNDDSLSGRLTLHARARAFYRSAENAGQNL